MNEVLYHGEELIYIPNRDALKRITKSMVALNLRKLPPLKLCLFLYVISLQIENFRLIELAEFCNQFVFSLL